MGDAHGADLADHRHRPRDQLLGFALDRTSDSQLPIRWRAAALLSIEIRKKVGQSYSTIGGLYRQFELIYIAADERDVIRLRTNYRNEDVYLYRTTISPARARERFLEYIHSLNALRNKARWYNAITTNCTTSIRTQHPPKERVPWDWRILLNGKGDELMYERHAIVTGGLPFAELKARSLIDTRARAANDSPDFSQLIREGLPEALASDASHR